MNAIRRKKYFAVAIALTLSCAEPSLVGLVESVVDGDTFILSTGERVRLLMVDAPEWGLRRQDCYGKEAANFMRSLLVHQRVILQFDEVTSDGYGRTLAYVEIDGSDVSTLMIERGYGKVMFIPPNGKKRYHTLKKIEQQAKAKRRGLWGRCLTYY